ncbi:hypothetical protein C8R47DRAFT_244047 [Mycena vitilis]|nr:hypothetical protein C8R47DRAFT_244047 [Mycena vitilis]
MAYLHRPPDKIKLPVSAFVIYTPKGSPPWPDNREFSHQDIYALEDALPTGGTIYSTHHPKDALAWAETHYDDRLLASMRSRGLGGPIASMLFPEMEALTIFGSVEKKWVLRTAQALADASGLAVIIQPRSKDPVLVWNESQIIHVDGESAARDSATDDPDLLPPNAEDVESGDQAVDVMVPPTGDDDVDQYTPWMSPVHTSDIRLRLHVSSSVEHDLAITAQTQFKIQSAYDRENFPAFHPPRPQVVSRTHLKVTSGNPRVIPDRSYGSIGLLSRDRLIKRMDWVDCGFDRRTHKSLEYDVKQYYFFLSRSLGWSKEFGKTTLTVDHNDPDAPKWTVSHERGTCLLNSNGPTYESWDLVYNADSERNGHPMEVVFSMGINLPHKDGPHSTAVPTVSFISRNQTLSWVPNDALKTKGFGMIVVTTSYLPDCWSHSPTSYVHEAELDLGYIPAAGMLFIWQRLRHSPSRRTYTHEP